MMNNINHLRQICRHQGKESVRLFSSACYIRVNTRNNTQRKVKAPAFLKPCRSGLKCVRLTHSSPESFTCSLLVERTLLRVAGKDATNYLQGLVTNDMRLLDNSEDDADEMGAPERTVMYAMMLNNQGRVLYDLIIYRLAEEAGSGPVYLVECEDEFAPEFLKLLKRYKIRKKVDLSAVGDEFSVWAVTPSEDLSDSPATLPLTRHPGLVCHATDPRLASFGQRVILRPDTTADAVLPGATPGTGVTDYTRRRYVWGLSEGSVDLPVANSLPLEANLVFLNGVSFSKGCYIGQELTARTHHTGVIRKRLMPVTVTDAHAEPTMLSLPPRSTASPKPGDKVENQAGKSCGKFRNFEGQHGLALLRIGDVIGKGPLSVKNPDNEPVASLQTTIPPWWPTETDEIIRQALATQ